MASAAALPWFPAVVGDDHAELAAAGGLAAGALEAAPGALADEVAAAAAAHRLGPWAAGPAVPVVASGAAGAGAGLPGADTFAASLADVQP